MGFLEAGTPLAWADSLEFAEYVRKHGIQQFLHTYNRIKDRHNDVLKWGDEIEYHLVQFSAGQAGNASSGGTPARIALIAPELLAKLEQEDKEKSFPIKSAWRPEYGSWMVEATPGIPYGGDTLDLRSVERNMAMRRYRISAALPAGVRPFSIVNFPLLGAGPFTAPARPAGGPFSCSAYVSDATISPHPRFGTLTANIRRRRGQKVEIQMPIYRDAHTTTGAVTGLSDARFCDKSLLDGGSDCTCAGMSATEATERADVAASAAAAAMESSSASSSSSSSAASAAAGSSASAASASSSTAAPCMCPPTEVGPAHVPLDGHIHMDAMAFGMGCCCLQVTFQARDLGESRYLYDQLAVMSPLMLALTANAPIWRGHLADHDTRWDVIAASVDCRTPFERGVEGKEPEPTWMTSKFASKAAAGGKRRIAKSRYSSVDCYISGPDRMPDSYNDVTLQYDDEAYQTLRAAGVDERLSKHVAHLFIRDPLVIFSERVTVDDSATTEHFENIQSTNWRSMRWKPPPADAPDIGWRVELRTMEAQVTDFENAAFTVFVVLLSRVMLFFDLNLYIPISKLDENFERARTRKALTRQKFWFRKRITERTCTPSQSESANTSSGAGAVASSAEGNGTTDGGASSSSSAAAQNPWGGCACDPDSFIAAQQAKQQAATAAGGANASSDPHADEYEEMTIEQILLGKASSTCASCNEFPGLIPLLHLYLDMIKCDEETRVMVDHYLRFVAGRATGAIMTGATWQRQFVRSHPAYKQDSVVSPQIATDLLIELDRIATGQKAAPELVGPEAPRPVVFCAMALEQLRLDCTAPDCGSHTSSRPRSVVLHVKPEEYEGSSSASDVPRAKGAGSASSATSDDQDGTASASSAPAAMQAASNATAAAAAGGKAITAHPLLPLPDGDITVTPNVMPSSTSPSAAAAGTTPNAWTGTGTPSKAQQQQNNGSSRADSLSPTTPNGTRMRGSSFAEEQQHNGSGGFKYECAALQEIIQSYRSRFGLDPSTPIAAIHRPHATASSNGFSSPAGSEAGKVLAFAPAPAAAAPAAAAVTVPSPMQVAAPLLPQTPLMASMAAHLQHVPELN